MKRLVLLFLCAVAGLPAAIDARALVLRVQQSQFQQPVSPARNDQRREKKPRIRHVRVLDLECRVLGDGRPERATLRWFFVGKNAADGRFDYYSHGQREVALPRKETLRLRIVSDAAAPEASLAPEWFTSVSLAAGAVPQGWVLWVMQDGEVVTREASEPGLIEWMARNPPPKPPKAAR